MHSLKASLILQKNGTDESFTTQWLSTSPNSIDEFQILCNDTTF